MHIVQLNTSKAINHEQLSLELGYPVFLIVNGNVIEGIQVPSHSEGIEEEVLTAVEAHIAQPLQPKVELATKDRLAAIEDRLKALESKALKP